MQKRGNWNAGHANQNLDNGSKFIKDYRDALSDGRAYKQPAWMTEVGTTVQNDPEEVIYHYTVDYLSLANRDIMVEAEGEYVTRYVYGANGERISAEYDYAENTRPGEAGENIVTRMAANDETLGLCFAQNRFYDAETHRFTQEDPVKDWENWYAYCANKPNTSVDILGLLVLQNGKYKYPVALTNLQKWLEYLGYLSADDANRHYGENT